jgi:hypothetical protein
MKLHRRKLSSQHTPYDFICRIYRLSEEYITLAKNETDISG